VPRGAAYADVGTSGIMLAIASDPNAWTTHSTSHIRATIRRTVSKSSVELPGPTGRATMASARFSQPPTMTTATGMRFRGLRSGRRAGDDPFR